METGEGRFTFKETRLNIEPSSSTYSVSVLVPSPLTNSRGHSRKPDNADGKSTDEEQLFIQRNLSTSASIFHRVWHDSPRSFLWRILEDGMVLSVRVVDVARQQRTADAPLILNFRFAAPIQPTCVALADPKDQDLLCIYVLDQQGCLYTFSLRPDLFRRRASINSSINDVFRVYVPAALSGRHAHRLLAVDSTQLLITLHDGGLLRLDRNKTHDCMSLKSHKSPLPCQRLD
jgi:nuclear pore complex protein Nup160